MTDDLTTRIQANCRNLSLPTARHVAGLLQRLEAEHSTGSEEGIEQAGGEVATASYAKSPSACSSFLTAFSPTRCPPHFPPR
jgi:hypothetical protein